MAVTLVLALVLPGCASRNVPPTPRDPVAHVYDGDLDRLQAQRARSIADKAEQNWLALARYERAAELDRKYPDPFRQLGLLYHGQRDAARARAAFEKYLALRPDAPDAKQIKGYLVELDR